MKQKLMIIGLMSSLLISFQQIGHAEAVDKYWGTLKQTYFPNKNIEENNTITLKAPVRAESGAQVPFEFSVQYPQNQDQYIKAVTIIADTNPVPLTAVYHFSPDSGKVAVNTRIRMESDAYIHVVAETNDGRFFMSKVPIRAAGGCGGSVGGDESLARQDAGKMKLSVKADDASALKEAHLLIKHPMYTGLQRDLVSQGYRPAFFINKITATYNDQTVFDADTYIGVSEDPNIQFPFKADKPGTLKVVIQDNEGKSFTTSTEVKVN
jgi:sulfur-oxidizing protein SoxY